MSRLTIYVLSFLFSFSFAQDKGIELFNDKKYSEAIEYYKKVLKKRKGDAAAELGLGSSAYYNDNIDLALKSFEDASKSDNDIIQSKALYNIARILQDKDEISKSLKLYKKALELNPSDVDTKINYEILKKMKNEEQQENQDQEGSQEQQENQDQEGSQEQQENQDQEGSQEQQENQDQEGSQEQQENQDQEGSQEQQENQDQEGSQEQQENQDQEGSQEQQENQDQEGSQEQQENQDQEGSSSADNIEKEKSDQMIQAEAILNALKGQEEINQKQKILKSKILRYEKDW